jgi:phage tail protein X
MALLYRTSEGDRIDLIVLKHYKDKSMLKIVIDANPHLAKQPLSLKAGVEIILPDVQVLENTKEELQAGDELW